jgi:peptide-methionine (S)-S-oxide reductase
MKRILAGLVLAAAVFAAPASAETRTAVFAGGCFWCMEPPFDKTPGVLSTTSGYTGGSVSEPTYRQVSSGSTGHAEVVKVEYDSTKVSYETLLQVFWRNVDPFDASGQFCDKGSQYRSAIFVATPEEKAAAQASLEAVKKQFGKAVATGIEPAATFWPAEGYHQDYYKKNTSKYEFYRLGCRRDARLAQVWGTN